MHFLGYLAALAMFLVADSDVGRALSILACLLFFATSSYNPRKVR